MKIKRILNAGMIAMCAAAVAAPLTGCSKSKTETSAGEKTEQTADTTVTAFNDGLFTPANLEEGKTYPLVVIIGENAEETGAAFVSEEAQKENPAYVYVGSDVQAIIDANAVDAKRVYSVGNTPDSDVYAASIIVNGTTPKELKDKNYIFFFTSAEPIDALQDSFRGQGISYTYAEIPADKTVAEQSDLTGVMLEKGTPVNIFQFAPGTITAEAAPAAAAEIPSVRAWIFAKSK